MKRRQFIAALGASTIVLPFGALAQQPPGKIPRLGVLLYNTPQLDRVAPFISGLESLGYIDGKTIAIDYRFAESKAERLPTLAAELVALKPDVIFAYGGDVAPHAKDATSSIPVVGLLSNDPVTSGLVPSLARPGGNLTGITLIYDELSGKILDLLKEAVPSVSRVAVMWNPNHADPEFRETQRAAASLGVAVQSLEVRGTGDFDAALNAAQSARADALVLVSSRLLFLQRTKLAEFINKSGMVTVGTSGAWAEAGALLTYGPSHPELLKRAAHYVDKIIKGARPADLPIERPTRFELVVNLKTAKTLGITFANSMLARADEVIE
jgi:putative ABC transport system substrate-binding protein